MTRSETRNIVVRLAVSTVVSAVVGSMAVDAGVARAEKRRPEEHPPGIALFIHLSAGFSHSWMPRMPGADSITIL